jgi:hypothetical protein
MLANIDWNIRIIEDAEAGAKTVIGVASFPFSSAVPKEPNAFSPTVASSESFSMECDRSCIVFAGHTFVSNLCGKVNVSVGFPFWYTFYLHAEDRCPGAVYC